MTTLAEQLDWLHRNREALHTEGARAMVDAVLAVHGRLSDIEAALEDLKDREAMTARQEALKAAREHVASMSSQQANERGYRDGAMRGPELVAQELRVARYLLGQEDE